MTSKELNFKLLNLLPDLKQLYFDEVSWQEGDETGSHTVFSDVVLPYILNNIEDRGRMENVFLAVESLFELHDEYVDEVLTLSILENIYYRGAEAQKLKQYFGTRTLKAFQEIENTCF